MMNHSIIGLLLTLISLALFPGYAFGQEAQETQLHWQTYLDPRFDFTIAYPANWTIEPRTDTPGTVGEVLTFRSPPLNQDQTYSIVIGQYSDPIQENEPLSVWTDRYNQRAGEVPDQSHLSLKKTIQVDNSDALLIRGLSALTEFQYTNIRRGETVWFVWANMGDATETKYLEIYEIMLHSLKFGPQSPLSLRELSLSKFRDGPGYLPDTGVRQPELEFVVWIGGGSVLLLAGGLLKLRW